MKNYILEGYLAYLYERQWDDPDDPGSTHPDLIRKVIGHLSGSDKLAQQRQAHQPNMLNVYIKRALGDYRGRADTLNSYRFKNIGIKDWDEIKKILKKAYDHERNKIFPERFLKGIMTIQNLSGEPLGKEIGPSGISDDGYSDGTSPGPQSMIGSPGGGGGD
jgi:hypothetical protein